MLLNFLEAVYLNKIDKHKDLAKNFGIFDKVRLEFVPNSVTYLKMISPMLKIIKEESFGSDMPIQLGALDQIFNDTKGSFNKGKQRYERGKQNAYKKYFPPITF